MFKHLLIPIDFSSCSINALRYAVQFALRMPNPVAITLLNSYNHPLDYSDINIHFEPTIEHQEIEDRIGEEFDLLKTEVPELLKLSYEKVIVQNSLGKAIKTFCDSNTVDLIIIGSSGASGIDETVLGSNAHRVIKMELAPVLMIPKDYEYKPIDNIAICNDYKGMIDEALEPLKEISLIYSSKLHLLHISDRPILDIQKSQAAKNLAEHLKKLPHQFHFMLDVQVEHGINQFITKEHIDLVVIVPRKKQLLDKLLRKSESRSLIFHSKIPLLALLS